MRSPITRGKDDNPIADETTALLAASGAAQAAEPNEQALDQASQARTVDTDDAPLPRSQIFLLCLARFIEPIAFFSIFPFINQMIYETGGIQKSDVGFYSGVIVR